MTDNRVTSNRDSWTQQQVLRCSLCLCKCVGSSVLLNRSTTQLGVRPTPRFRLCCPSPTCVPAYSLPSAFPPPFNANHQHQQQEFIDIVETVYRGARKGRGLVVSPKDYSTKYRY